MTSESLKKYEQTLSTTLSCPVCMSEYSTTAPMVLKCGHSICIDCMCQGMHKRKYTCPKCRSVNKAPTTCSFDLLELARLASNLFPNSFQCVDIKHSDIKDKITKANQHTPYQSYSVVQDEDDESENDDNHSCSRSFDLIQECIRDEIINQTTQLKRNSSGEPLVSLAARAQTFPNRAKKLAIKRLRTCNKLFIKEREKFTRSV